MNGLYFCLYIISFCASELLLFHFIVQTSCNPLSLSLSLYRLDQLCSICRDGRPCMCTNEEKEMWYITALSNSNKIDLGYNWLPGFGLWHHIIKAFVKTPARLNTTSTADWFYTNMILPPNHPTPPNHPGLAFNVTPIRPTVSDSFS